MKMLTNADRDRLFGRFSFKPAPSAGNPERIVVNPAWMRANIVSVPVDELFAIRFPSTDTLTPDPGILGLPHHGIDMHRLVALHFEDLIRAWNAAGLLSLIKTWNGSYVPRFRRGQADTQNLSAHSWGSAFDINARWNGFRRQPSPLGEEGSVLALVPIANKLGWVWGGDFSTPDGMHFEAGYKLIGA